jgi:hypothetical protein
MNIVAQYDSSVTNAPAGFKTAVQAAVNYIDHLIATPITVSLTFSWGELQGQALGSGAIGESASTGNLFSYSSVLADLTQAATSTADHQALATLSSSDPTNGGSFYLAAAQELAFGQSVSASTDGEVALNSSDPYSFNPADRAVSGEYDAIGVLEHEITEALGRISDLGQGSRYTPLDLFRYSAPGQHELTPASGDFSVDGQHMLLQYNNPSNGGDGGDWANAVQGDSFGTAYAGVEGAISPADVLELDVLGYKIALPRSTDFHNDGLSNLLIQNSNGAVDIGEAAGASVSWEQLGGLGSAWKFVGAGDYLGDGQAGYLIESTNGAVDVGQVGPDTSATYTQVAALGPEWTVVGSGDLLGDGKFDMLIENNAGAVDVGEADPLSGKMAWSQVGSLGSEWSFAGVGDFLGQGHDQFLIRNSNGAVDLGDVQNGKAVYTQIAALGSAWKIVETGDFLGTGKWDIAIENANGAVDVGEVGANGQVSWSQVGALGSEWKFVSAGDYLGVGHAQLLIQNANGAVDVASVAGGHLQYTQVAALGSAWSFHG